MKPITLLLSFCVFALACTDHDAETAALRNQLVTEGVKIKVQDFKDREWAKCVGRARDEAVIHVDSLIRAMAKQSPIEPVPKPPKPERPVKPETKVLPDSVKLKIQGKNN